MGNRVIRDGSVTLSKLSDEVMARLDNGGVEMLTQDEYNALPEKDARVLYCIVEE